MNIPNSSPLVPQPRGFQDGPRSLSLTAAQQPGMRSGPTDQYSIAGARSHDLIRPSRSRPESPVSQQAFMAQRRTAGRATSPALSDNMALRPPPGRGRYHNGPYPPHNSLPLRHGNQPDGYLRRPEESYNWNRPPSRSRTPVGLRHMSGDIPPVPPLPPQHRASAAHRGISQVSQHSLGSASHRSGNTSFSSHSTNQRFDSDGPSSDATFPPTPQDGQAGHRMARPLSVHPDAREQTRNVKEEVRYYDGSEAFEVPESSLAARPSHDIRTIMEEQPVPNAMGNIGEYDEYGEDVGHQSGMAQLPAFPAPQRLTRDWVKAVLKPVSNSGDSESSKGFAGRTVEDIEGTRDEPVPTSAAKETISSSLQAPQSSVNRHSILSQAGSSIIDSSTLKFAVTSAIPMVAERGITMDTEDEDVSGLDSELPTEDGMSDVLGGYQHTDTRTEGGSTDESQIGTSERAGKRISKSSDRRSFRSYADIPGPTEAPVYDSLRPSNRSKDGLSAPENLRQDPDALSFEAGDDTITPDGALFAATVENLVSNFAGMSVPKPNMEMLTVPTSSATKPLVSNSESTMPHFVTGQQSLLDSSAKSRSTPMLDKAKNQPPTIPPRQSSSKPNAKTWFRPFLPRRNKTSPDATEKPSEHLPSQEERMQESVQGVPTPPPMQDRPISSEIRSSALAAYEGVADKKDRQPMIQQTSGDGVGYSDENASRPFGVPRARGGVQPLLPAQQRPSAYRFKDNSSIRQTQFSPVMPSETSEPSHRDSQSTTHLSWPVPRATLHPDVHAKPQATLNEQEETTTDLKMMKAAHTYHSKFQSGYLPNVKEESHEDSSLNTSASNPKRSSVRFSGVGSQQGNWSVRGSMDDDVLLDRVSSPQSQRMGATAKVRALPSLNFTEEDMVKDVLHNFRSSKATEVAEEEEQGPPDAKQSPEVTAEGSHKGKSKLSDKTEPVNRRRNVSPLYLKEIDELDVPSTQELDERISGYLPEMKRNSDTEGAGGEDIIESAIEEIHGVGNVPTNKSSNARLRAIPGSPKMVVVEDEVYQNIRSKKEVEGQGGQLGASSGDSSRDTTSNNTATTTQIRSPSPADLAAAHLTPRGGIDSSPAFVSRISSSSADSSIRTASSSDTRPWNSSNNYPWVRDTAVDFSLPLTRSPRYQQRQRPASPPATAIAPPNLLRQPRPGSRSRPSVNRGTELLPTISETSCSQFGAPVQATSGAHQTGDRYPSCALPLPADLQLPGEGIENTGYTSDEEFPQTTRRQSRSDKKKARRDARTRLEEHRHSYTEEPTQLPARRNRNTFTGVEGMPRTTYLVKSTVTKVKKLGRKFVDKIRRFGRRNSKANQGQNQQVAPTVRVEPRAIDRI